MQLSPGFPPGQGSRRRSGSSLARRRVRVGCGWSGSRLPTRGPIRTVTTPAETERPRAAQYPRRRRRRSPFRRPELVKGGATLALMGSTGGRFAPHPLGCDLASTGPSMSSAAAHPSARSVMVPASRSRSEPAGRPIPYASRAGLDPAHSWAASPTRCAADAHDPRALGEVSTSIAEQRRLRYRCRGQEPAGVLPGLYPGRQRHRAHSTAGWRSLPAPSPHRVGRDR